jgi:acyl CoA:acetate/3-ketoacid CoA transferase
LGIRRNYTMYEIMTADEAIYRRYQKMQSPTHLTMISSAGFGVWDDEHNAEGISEKDPELTESQLMIRWLSM